MDTNKYQKLCSFMSVATRVLPGKYPPNSCIAFTRIVKDSLEPRGFDVQPHSVNTLILNPPLKRRIQHEKRVPKDLCELWEWHKQDGCNLTRLGGSGATIDGCWDGHLIARIGEAYIDLALPQVNCPNAGVLVHPLLFDDTFLAAGGINVNECFVMYKHTPENLGFIETPDWNPQKHEDVVSTITRELRNAA